MPTPPSGPVDVRAALARTRVADPTRPALTWYAADGERVELSARVLENWVAKTSNLLIEELDAVPGPPPTAVALLLPPHWRTVVWRLALGVVGAALTDDAAAAGVVVVADGAEGADAGAAGAGALLVVQALAPLAFTAQHVPPGALDAAAVLAGFGDDVPRVTGPSGAPGPSGPNGAVGAVGLQLRQPLTTGRVLVEAADPQAVDVALAAVLGGGSAVLLGPGAPDAGRVAAQEGVTSLPPR